jgi:acyl carrier protein
MEKEAVYNKIKEIMVNIFELDPGAISPEKKLEDDLQLDSLDMVDLVLSLNDENPNEKIEPTVFKEACTVQDLVDLVHPVIK